MSTAVDTASVTSVGDLLGVLDVVADQLEGVDTTDLVGLGPDEVLAVARRFEMVRNRLGRMDQLVVAACDALSVADRHHCGSVTTLLAGVLRISRGEARARVTAAEQLLAHASMTGELVPVRCPALADAVATGRVGRDVADVALRAMGKIEHIPGVAVEQVETADRVLAEQAVSFGPREFRHLAQRVVDHVNPDGTLTDDEGHQSRRSVGFHQVRDGSFRIEGRLTPGLGEKLQALLGPLTKPQDGPDGPDLRSVDQRRHDALEMLVDRLLRSGGLPESGGVPSTVVVVVGLAELLSRSGHGNFADGTPVATVTVLRDAAQARIVPVVLGVHGEVLAMGRTQRCATTNQTWALYARDRGCSFPGCLIPPQWCERHHVVAWIDGGDTDIDNLTLLCKYHHHNFERLRWRCRMVDGLPWWIPPGYLDPAQTPMINTRITGFSSAAAMAPLRT